MATVEQPIRSEEIRVENPATGDVVATVPRIGADAVPALVARARAAQPAWEALGFDGRAHILRRAQKWIVDNSDRLARTIVSETGKAYDDALVAEIAYAASAFGFWAKNAPRFLADEKVRASSPFLLGRRLVVRYRPLTNSFGDCIPALAAGNTVVLKPSQSTPLTSLLMADALRECGLPDDVYLVATGDGATGEALIDEVDMIMFTGSTATGKRVLERAARTLTPVSLELGGKDPMIVLADADVERAANSAVYASMQNGGQTCVSIERVYVEAPIYEDFVDRVARKVAALRQGVPDGPGSVDVGAMTFAPQLDIVSRHVEEARQAGARVLTGGRADLERGRFYAPTVLADVDHSMRPCGSPTTRLTGSRHRSSART
jgi:acyl-CoA reductase-like NAD-dependent aldehyde dehydrogenase